MIIGGATNEESNVNYVMVYDIDYDIYLPTEAQSHPIGLERTTVVNKDGYMYTFGGWNSVFKTDFKTVARISLTLDEPWETLEDMETSDYDITVIPYN